MKRSPKLESFVRALILLFLLSPAWGQSGRHHFDTSHSIDWTLGEISSLLHFDFAASGIRLPAGRFQAEEILREAYPRQIRTFLMSIRLDSNTTIGDMVARGEVSLAELDALCRAARQVPPSLSPDLRRITGRYTVFMQTVSSLFTRHRFHYEPLGPLVPIPTAAYTGIIIIADNELPVHGRWTSALLEPSVFPRIWDTEMNLVYDRNMFDPALRDQRLMVNFAVPESVFRPTPSGLEGELAVLLGANPLRVFATGVFGVYPTDPIISRHDALRILSSENNRRLLREGRVLFVLNEDMVR